MAKEGADCFTWNSQFSLHDEPQRQQRLLRLVGGENETQPKVTRLGRCSLDKANDGRLFTQQRAT